MKETWEMNRIIRFILICLVGLTLSGCTGSTEFGVCVGVTDDRDPKLAYKLNANNLVWAILGFELVFPPIIVAVDETYCPVGRK